MSDMSDDGLRIDRDTTPDDIREFVERRATNPITIVGVTIWNFSTHDFDPEALANVAGSLHRDEYVIPYQVPGAWGYIQRLLPQKIRNAELLVYSQADQRYKAFPNFGRLSDTQDDYRLRIALSEQIINEALEDDAGE